MQSIIDARYYRDRSVFDREQDRIFRTLWIFAGLRTLLTEPNSYVTRNIGGTPITIQNFDGEIRAFVNRCVHRQSPLHVDDHGVGRLACPYHGWVYDRRGQVAHIPQEESMYGFNAQSRSVPGLRPVHVQCIGSLIFINLADKPFPIDSQFSQDFLARIAFVSKHLDSDVLFSRFEAGMNWKLAFENVVDSHHVWFVHSRSFAPVLREAQANANATAAPTTAEYNSDAELLPSLSFERKGPFNVTPWPWHQKVTRFSAENLYYNWFIYPNVNFISIGGVIFLIQQFMPKSPARTDYHLWVATAHQAVRNPATPAILWSQAKAEKSVIDEDLVVLEALQKGLDSGERAFQGAYETRLRAMAKIYMDLVS